MPLQAEPKRYTPATYLEREEQAETRSEYRNGAIVPMAGGTANHNRVAGQSYEIFIGDMRLWIPAMQLYTYPDVTVIQGAPVYHQNRQDTLENPHLIVEVLSKSTRQYDQTDKFDAYRSLASLQEYILVDQYSLWVKQLAKNVRGQWVFTELLGRDAVLQLESVAFEIRLVDLYRRVQFEVDG